MWSTPVFALTSVTRLISSAFSSVENILSVSVLSDYPPEFKYLQIYVYNPLLMGHAVWLTGYLRIKLSVWIRDHCNPAPLSQSGPCNAHTIASCPFSALPDALHFLSNSAWKLHPSSINPSLLGQIQNQGSLFCGKFLHPTGHLIVTLCVVRLRQRSMVALAYSLRCGRFIFYEPAPAGP